MNSGRSWFLVLLVLAAVGSVRPASQFLLRSEIERCIGSRVSMDRCQLNLLTGGLVIDQAVIGHRPGDAGFGGVQVSPTRVAKIWSQGSINQFFHRKLVAPTTLMDGVEVKIDQAQEHLVPCVEPTTQARRDATLLINPTKNPFIDEWDATFRSAEVALERERTLCERIDRQLTDLEHRALPLENPLRSREILLELQQAIAGLSQELDGLRHQLDEERDAFQTSTVETARLAKELVEEPSANPVSESSGAVDEVRLKARRLAEQLACSSVERAKPYLGLMASMTYQWLLLEHGSEARHNHRLSRSVREGSRGIDYDFRSANADDFLFSSIRMRGEAKWIERSLPFTGRMNYIGSRSPKRDERPSMTLQFTGNTRHESEETPRVHLSSVAIPDGQGFKMRCQFQPTGSTIASVAKEDWMIAAFGQDSLIQVEWLLHQTEWSLAVNIRSSQGEVLVKRNALDADGATNEILPRFEPCFKSDDSRGILYAKFQGRYQNGLFEQMSLEFHSPIIEPLADAMLEQEKIFVQLVAEKKRKETLANLERTLVARQAKWDAMHRQVSGSHTALNDRLARFELKVAQASIDRDDFRFAREPSQSLQR